MISRRWLGLAVISQPTQARGSISGSAHGRAAHEGMVRNAYFMWVIMLGTRAQLAVRRKKPLAPSDRTQTYLFFTSDGRILDTPNQALFLQGGGFYHGKSRHKLVFLVGSV